MSKAQGGHAMTTHESKARARRRVKRRRQEEAAWRDKAGPLTVRFVDPETLKGREAA